MIVLWILLGVALLAVTVLVAWTRRAVRWGATPDELASPGPSDAWFRDVPGTRGRYTRGISIDAPPQTVWCWLAQTGRGAGWFSRDRLDNRGIASARHLVSWIPEPEVGDAAAIGYLRHLEPGRELVWWGPETSFLGATTWSAWTYRVTPAGEGSRLFMRADFTAVGVGKWLVLALFPIIDSLMAIRQLRTLKNRAERYGDRTEDPDAPETGARDQFQHYHVIYASGDTAGVPGAEGANKSREHAEAAGVV